MPIKDVIARREYQRKWMAIRRAEFFKDKCCVVCGAGDNLEIDHIDPSQKISPRIWSWSTERRIAELAKCRVLCAKHHDKRHKPPLTHGTAGGWSRTWKCRCSKCREWARVAKANWRARKKNGV